MSRAARLSATTVFLLAACGSDLSDGPVMQEPDAGMARETAALDAVSEQQDGQPTDHEDAQHVPPDVLIEVGDGSSDGAIERIDATGVWSPYGVLSLNLHCLKLDGTAFGNNQERFAAIASAVHAENVHAIAAQEVCSNDAQEALQLLEQALETETGQGWSTTFAHAHTAWEGTTDQAEEGVALFVRGEVTDAHVLEYRVQSGLKRVAISGDLPASLGGFRLMSTHLDFTDPVVREAQARETAALALATTDPAFNVLVAGDFNDVPGSPSLEAMDAMGFVRLTGPLGPDEIDHVFAHRATRVMATDARVVFDGTTYPAVSDHPGMLVTLSPAAGESVVVTRLMTQVDMGPANLWVRGDVSPLSWGQGWPAWRAPGGAWTLVLTQISAGQSFAYKFLRDDVAWETGDDHVGVGGSDQSSSPSF